MEKRGARLFQHAMLDAERDWNIVELESRRQLRRNVNELVGLAKHSSITTSEMQHCLLQGVASFGTQLAMQLVRSLHRDDPYDRQAIVWLLNLLDEQETIPVLRSISMNKKLPRSVRLSAGLALAGLGATEEMAGDSDDTRWYAIS